ncbi:unnamed protein product [Cutaneotrichosporon oleaginosum]
MRKQLYKASRCTDNLTALSGGQWQRVALARAFMAAPHADMVMFDEPSSNLDPEAEADLFRALHSLSSAQEGHRTTTIYVSHRMQTVGRAQRIILLEHGAIGRYFDLYTVQRDGFI